MKDIIIKNISEKGDEVFYSCPFSGHKHGDYNPSASMNKNTTIFQAGSTSPKASTEQGEKINYVLSRLCSNDGLFIFCFVL